MPSITSIYLFAWGSLVAMGDGLANSISLSRNLAGQLFINAGAVSIGGGVPSVSNTKYVQLLGQAGDDVLSVDDGNGPLPPVYLFGGTGNDLLIGGAGDDTLRGDADNDTLLGGGGGDVLLGGTGNDILFGGAGNDALTGGPGADQVNGEAGNDRLIWNAGDGSDLFEGGTETDTAEVNGDAASETFFVATNGARVRIDVTGSAAAAIDVGTIENISIGAGAGDDRVDASGLAAGLAQLTVDGGAGQDTLTGSQGSDILLGGDGDDTVTGLRGNDLALLGNGADRFVWNPGNGSDVVEGQVGFDVLDFNGSNVSEQIDIAANGGRVRLFRDVGAVTMDLNGVERIELAVLGGADGIVVGDLSGTNVTQVAIDPGAAVGGGDGQADRITVQGSAAADAVVLLAVAGQLSLGGLPATINVGNSEATDALVFNGNGGDDSFSAETVPTGLVALTIDGGSGNDTLTGSQGADVMLGGDGLDTLRGGRGNDLALMGADDDSFTWNPGDGSDVVEGQTGSDTLVFNGSNVSEVIGLSANGGRVRLTRDVGAITMDLNGVETVEFSALGGSDAVVVGDLAGTDVGAVNLHLAASLGGASGDSQADVVTLNAGSAADVVHGTTAGGVAQIAGLAAVVRIDGIDASGDQLLINGGDGSDVIDLSGLTSPLALLLDGGAGADLLVGSALADTVRGGRDADAALLGGGDDVFVWNPGDGSDIVEGQSGTDTLQFNGSNVSEGMQISANGGRVRMTRDVGAITMDLNDVETVELKALGGSDSIEVLDLSGTDLTKLSVDLGASGGGGDGQVDLLTLHGTAAADVIALMTSGSDVIVTFGLRTLTLHNFEPGLDQLRILAESGDDVIDASGLAAGYDVTLDGGDGDDVLIGGGGNDTLLGGNGDDVLIGGPGLDILIGGPGNNILIP